jgi:hypothetical protein
MWLGEAQLNSACTSAMQIPFSAPSYRVCSNEWRYGLIFANVLNGVYRMLIKDLHLPVP